MIDRLYLARGDRTCGPYSSAQLRGLAAAGQIRPTDSVWREGAIENAVDAGKVKNLFPALLIPAPVEGAGVPEAYAPAPSPPSHGPLVPSESAPTPPDMSGKTDEPDATAVLTDSAPPYRPELLGAVDPTLPGRAVPKEKAPRPAPEPIRKRRAIALKGATILSQDGATVHYRKKCTQCGFEDRCRSSMPIGNGMTRVHFYCPECRKGRDVQIQGIMQ